MAIFNPSEHPSIKERALRTLPLATTLALGLTACGEGDSSPASGTVKCDTVQFVTAESGDTFSGLVDEFVNTEGIDPSDLPHLVDGITYELRGNEGDLPEEFEITAAKIDAPAIQVTAGDTYELPKFCEKVS